MGAMTNLLLKDDANPLVEYTFIPISDTPNPLWRTAVSSVPFEGQMRLSCTSEVVKSGDYKYTVKLEVPVMETLGASGTSAGYVAPPKVAYVNTAIFTMFSSARATRQDRANLLKLIQAFLSGGSSTTVTGVLDGASAADAWKNSTLPAPQIFVDGIIPN
jgi:hypothetical protein